MKEKISKALAKALCLSAVAGSGIAAINATNNNNVNNVINEYRENNTKESSVEEKEKEVKKESTPGQTAEKKDEEHNVKNQMAEDKKEEHSVKINSMEAFQAKKEHEVVPNTFDGPKIMFNGKEIKITAFFDKLSSENLKKVQQIIDAGHACAAYNRLNNEDGKFTYIAGHNPGVMSPLAKYAKDGKEVTIVDVNGAQRNYVLRFVGRQAYGNGTLEDKFDELFNDNREAVVFQFCRNKSIEFWEATPAK